MDDEDNHLLPIDISDDTVVSCPKAVLLAPNHPDKMFFRAGAGALQNSKDVALDRMVQFSKLTFRVFSIEKLVHYKPSSFFTCAWV